MSECSNEGIERSLQAKSHGSRLSCPPHTHTHTHTHTHNASKKKKTQVLSLPSKIASRAAWLSKNSAMPGAVGSPSRMLRSCLALVTAGDSSSSWLAAAFVGGVADVVDVVVSDAVEAWRASGTAGRIASAADDERHNRSNSSDIDGGGGWGKND